MFRYNVFVESAEIADVVALLSTLTGEALQVRQGDVGRICSFRAMGIDFVVIDQHEMEDDAGMQFSQYPCLLNLIPLRIGEGLDTYSDMLRAIACFAGQFVAASLACSVLVAKNLQVEIAQYGPHLAASR